MRQIDFLRLVVASALPATLLGCGIFGDSKPSLAKVDDLVDRIERVHVESELAKEASQAGVRHLRTLASRGFSGDPVQAHTALMASVEASENQAERLSASFDDMERAAEPVFDQWRADLDAIVSARVRTRSEDRMRETRSRYAAIVAAVRPTLEEYAALNRSLRDLTLFLGHDFNATAIAAVDEDVQALEQQVAALDGQLRDCLDAAQAYLDAAAIDAGGLPPGDLAAPPSDVPPNPGR